MSHHKKDEHYPITSQEKFNNSGIMTTAKPISSQTGEAFPLPDPAPKIPWSQSRFTWSSTTKGGLGK